jgi:predicted GNAT superfamily acetyltransferase
VSSRGSGSELDESARLVRFGEGGRPLRVDTGSQTSQNLVIEIPGNIGLLKQDQPNRAVEWRRATREAFLQAFSAGYTVTGFSRSGQLGAYILTSSGQA